MKEENHKFIQWPNPKTYLIIQIKIIKPQMWRILDYLKLNKYIIIILAYH